MDLKKVFVTGALGRIAHVVIPSLQSDFELHLSDKAPTSDLPNYRCADLTDFRSIADAVQGMDAIVHLAIASRREYPDEVSEFELDPFDEMTMEVNVQGTYHLMEAARRAGVRRIVYLSSFTAHLGNRHRPLYDENTPLDPHSLYACTKIFGENLARVYHRRHDISIICLRIGQPYPTGTEIDDIWRTNKRARSTYVALDDVSRAIQCALKTDVAYGVYNIVSASDNPRISLQHAREIGYVPTTYFADSGLSVHEDGDFPPFTGEVVTH